mmetsp:Transcript_82813/g.230951  ORF Transcript_82813/g.230951 Transcript_82813/m.230951 type:complete len:236 (+) Transcript_82813:132-839(+)
MVCRPMVATLPGGQLHGQLTRRQRAVPPAPVRCFVAGVVLACQCCPTFVLTRPITRGAGDAAARRCSAARATFRRGQGSDAGIAAASSGTFPARPRQAWRRRLKTWAAVCAAGVAALAVPAAAVARTARRHATRQQEQRAGFFTAGALALLFVLAYFNSKKEDDSENKRIKSEVERLVRLKKEFEEAEANEDLSDDSMAAALRKAKEDLGKEKDGDEEGDQEVGDDEFEASKGLL